jgi:ADP-heptose:LPS heptosyltransferase
MKILIIQLSAIGDIIYTLFNIKALFQCQCNPDLIIDWLCAKPNNLLAVQPEIRRVLTLNKDVLPDDYDYILDFGSKSSTLKVKVKLNYSNPQAIKIGFQSKATSLKKALIAFFNDFSVFYDHSISVIANQRKLLTGFFRFHLDGPRPVLTIPDDIKKQVDLYLAGLPAHKPLVILNPNASVAAKEYPLDYWTSAITQYSDDNLILIGEYFGQKGQQLARLRLPEVYILPAALDHLLAVAYLLLKSRLLISPDTSILHLAEFQGVPVQGLFTEKSNLQIKDWGQL